MDRINFSDIGSDFLLHESFKKKVLDVSGSCWCPYPSEGFMKAVVVSNNAKAKELILKRRKYDIFDFLEHDPMEEELEEILIRESIYGN